MGISQLPTTPVPTAKGDLIVGTATGATRLPVSTTQNQTLVVDSTTTTGLKYGSPSRAWTLATAIFTNPTSGASEIGTDNPGSKVIFSNGTYAFVLGRYIFYSTDKLNWTAQLVSTSGLQTIATNGSIWVVGGGANTLFSGTPGGTWTARTSQLSGTGGPRHIIWQPSYNLFICAGNGNASPWVITSYSSDGITWTVGYTSSANHTMHTLATNNSTTTVAVGNQTSPNAIFTTNGTSWTVTNANGSSSTNYPVIYLPTAGRFQLCSGNSYSQTPAAIATAWSTSPVTYYNSFNSYITQQSNYKYAPEYDSVRGVWYLLTQGYDNTPTTPSSTGASHMTTISDTVSARYYFDASNNYFSNKLNAVEPLPVASQTNTGNSPVVLSLANNTLFVVAASGYQMIIQYSDLA